MSINKPLVGVGVIIKRDNTVLIGKRINSHGDGTWSFPGGHLEFGESPEQCAVREVEEETGLHISDVSKLTFTNDIFPKENKHYITLFVTAVCKNGDPQLLEPQKCAEWKWVEWNNLPRPLFTPIENLIKEGINPFA
jgi:8-oxo-dGTP diphosphatase